MDTPQKKLDFTRPPVDEVVLSVLFEPLDAFLAPHLGEIWQEFKKDGFERIVEQPPVPPTVEKFPNSIEEPQLRLGNVPHLARIWFVHKDDNQIIQVQRDRFTFNWRKTELNQDYPGFSVILDMFKGFYGRFDKMIKNIEVGAITPLQYELTYIDRLLRGDGWETFNDVGKIYNLFVDSQQSDSFWSHAESMILRTSFSVPDLHGRLHLTISDRIRVSDQLQTLQTDFTVRGFTENVENDTTITWFKAARDRIIEKFSSMFTEDIQTQVWGRK